jgi:hypothetical protein
MHTTFGSIFNTKSDYVKQATTLRLPPNYVRRLRITAAVRDTTSVALVTALDRWFEKSPFPTKLDE